MGLFQSKSQEEWESELRNFIQQSGEERRQLELRLRRQEELRREQNLLHLRFESLHLGGEKNDNKHLLITTNLQMMQDLLESIGCRSELNKVSNGTYALETLDENSLEFQLQKNKFRRTNKPCYKLTQIQKVYNPYLLLHYTLKEHQSRHRTKVLENKMFYHGTKKQNIDSVCESNFNWRLCGSSTGHKFGRGVSFAPQSRYATHYGDKKSFEKVMIVASVLVGERVLGDGNTIIPYGTADTTTNDKKSVYVKYEDNAFLPTFVIYYEGFEFKNKKKKLHLLA
ncbi:hypothetical protein JTB14_016684 [Gonioctena quinquepunctata]|nr:hypothetical protein JTB14_016684 [Gonioctena quinquepunctata]